MRDIFQSIDAITQSDWFRSLPVNLPPQKNQVLKSLRVEDETYRQLRRDSSILEEIETTVAPKLPVIENLYRDVFQSFYGLTLRHNHRHPDEPGGTGVGVYSPAVLRRDHPAVTAGAGRRCG